jgi:uncharacterized membrane protein
VAARVREPPIILIPHPNQRVDGDVIAAAIAVRLRLLVQIHREIIVVRRSGRRRPAVNVGDCGRLVAARAGVGKANELDRELVRVARSVGIVPVLVRTSDGRSNRPLIQGNPLLGLLVPERGNHIVLVPDQLERIADVVAVVGWACVSPQLSVAIPILNGSFLGPPVAGIVPLRPDTLLQLEEADWGTALALQVVRHQPLDVILELAVLRRGDEPAGRRLLLVEVRMWEVSVSKSH